MIELTKDDLRNGWTAESLRRYRAEREAAASNAIANRRPKRPDRTNSGFKFNGRLLQPRRWHRSY